MKQEGQSALGFPERTPEDYKLSTEIVYRSRPILECNLTGVNVVYYEWVQKAREFSGIFKCALIVH